MPTLITTSNKIALITTYLGFDCTTFKTYEELLKTILARRIDELQKAGIKNPGAAAIQIKIEVKNQLNGIIEANKDDPEEVCPISGATNCDECPDWQMKICSRENIGHQSK